MLDFNLGDFYERSGRSASGDRTPPKRPAIVGKMLAYAVRLIQRGQHLTRNPKAPD